MKYTGCSGYIHWSTKICELSRVPLATEYVCFSSPRRGAENAYHGKLSWNLVLCQFHNSDIRCQLIYLSHIVHIRVYSMTYLTGWIVICIEITLFQQKKSICDRQSFFESTVYFYQYCLWSVQANNKWDAFNWKWESYKDMRYSAVILMIS